MDLPARERFFDALAQAIEQRRFVRLVLSKPLKSVDELERVDARLLQLRGQVCLSFVYQHRSRDVTRNEPLAAAHATIQTLLGEQFAHAHLFEHGAQWQLRMSRKGRYSLHVAHEDVAASSLPAASAQHDRQKRRLLTLQTPFLAALGVVTPDHELVPAMARKWKQINKFVEIMAHALESSGLLEKPALKVVDFGAGKGYLTFALHDYLHRQRMSKSAVLDVIGVELRPDLVRFCNDVVAQCGLYGLRFEAGDVAGFAATSLDVMIALHACDTATDHALHTGIRAGAAVIMCSPCCHKQIRPQMHMPPLLRPMLQHGIHLGQQAEMVTDSLRALLLQAHGYEAQVFEFVALEHTSKNKMILAVRRTGADTRQMVCRRAELLMQVEEIKRFYGIQEHCLETLLAQSESTLEPRRV